MTQLLSPSEVVAFWTEAGPEKWFARDDAFDRAFTDRCRDTHYAAARRELDGWTQTAEGGLALIILLDQLPRNAFRGTGHMFATDSLALMFAKAAIERGDDRRVAPHHRPLRALPASQPLPGPRDHARGGGRPEIRRVRGLIQTSFTVAADA